MDEGRGVKRRIGGGVGVCHWLLIRARMGGRRREAILRCKGMITMEGGGWICGPVHNASEVHSALDVSYGREGSKDTVVPLLLTIFKDLTLCGG
jgi:hypothetical protein